MKRHGKCFSESDVATTYLVRCGWAGSHHSSSRCITLQCGECGEGLVVGVQVGVKPKGQQEPCVHTDTNTKIRTAGRAGRAGAVQRASGRCCQAARKLASLHTAWLALILCVHVLVLCCVVLLYLTRTWVQAAPLSCLRHSIKVRLEVSQLKRLSAPAGQHM
jgi:hypothetical protein